jgi:hypothetical protein
MGMVEAKIQTVEDMYRLVWKAVSGRRAAFYGGQRRAALLPSCVILVV